MRRRRIPSYGERIYPSPSARRGKVRIGVTPFLRCSQCGLPNDTRKTGWSNEGEGLSDPVTVAVAKAPGQASGNVNTKERTVQGGCRFCGSLKWRPSKPSVLPDDRNKPASEKGIGYLKEE